MKASVNLGSRQYALIVLTVITALLHLLLGIGGEGFFQIAFILNGVGYLALLAAFYFLPQFAGQRGMVRWAFLGFTAVTFILYFVFNWPDIWGPMGLLDKAVELVMIILLYQEG
ncbi:MAG: hypothetical protein ACE5FD_17970 [Anaerolineae bacterium]